MEKLQRVLTNWGFKKSEIMDQYRVGGSRIVCKVNTDHGMYILKGIPTDINEKIVIGNTKAHEYLGNEKGLAPGLIFLPDDSSYRKEEGYYFYLMEFVSGRQLEETLEDMYALGQAAARLHELNDYGLSCSFDSEEEKKVFLGWFGERSFKAEYDIILENLPNFNKYTQCFIHTDIGPHNAMFSEEGKVVFVDLDDAGIGSKYIDLGWPFIMQFVNFNKETHEMHYEFDLAKAFLKGYYGELIISKEELDMIWDGAIYMHISYMQCFGPDAVESLWKILKFGMEQKDQLYQMLQIG